MPSNSSYAIVAEPTLNNRLGLMPIDAMYPEIPPGTSLAALMVDVKNILDQLGTNNNLAAEVADLQLEVTTVRNDIGELKAQTAQLISSVNELLPQVQELNKSTFYTHSQAIPQVNWIISHGKESTNFVCNVFDITGNAIIPDNIRIIDANTVVITLATASAGNATFFIHS
jgi:predicted nuclease with TOPRIM domain